MDPIESLSIVQRNLFSPLTLAFVLGMTATLVKSDVEFPESAYTFIAFYLMFAIGLNGGVELSATSFAAFAMPALVTLFLALLLPTLCYWVLRTLFRFDVPNTAGVAACTARSRR
jgi:hypothetical protein